MFSAVVFAFEFYLSLRQLSKYKSKTATLSPQLKDVVTEETFKKSLLYGFDKLSFEMIEVSITFIESFALVLLGYLPFLWDKSKQVCDYSRFCNYSNSETYTGNYSSLFQEMATTTIFLALSSIHDSIISLPFSLYSTFVVEQRHGFNKSTLGLFLRDKLLTLVLTLGLGSPVLSGVIALVRWGGQYFYVYVWFFLFVIGIVLMTVYPTLIAPLFNKYTKLESGEIYEAIEQLAGKVSFPLTQIYVVDGSKRSAHSNAYFYGFFKVRLPFLNVLKDLSCLCCYL